jgi:hypothetical protein
MQLVNVCCLVISYIIITPTINKIR